MQIKHVLATKGAHVHTVRPSQTLRDVVGLLDKFNVGALVVVDDGNRPVGIISERDVVHTASQNIDFGKVLVAKAMTRKVVVGSANDEVRFVMEMMTQKRFRHLPIVDQGVLVGIVSIGDLVKAMLDDYQGRIETLETTLTG